MTANRVLIDRKEVTSLASVLDVASYIIEARGELSAKKLQKLTYYCQAWSLVWLKRAIFDSRIEAWRDGPVIPELYRLHKGQYLVRSIEGGNSSRLSSTDKDSIDSVLGFYGDRSAEWLIDRSHSEEPWKIARRGLLPFQSGHREITLESMQTFYSSVSLGP